MPVNIPRLVTASDTRQPDPSVIRTEAQAVIQKAFPAGGTG
jgi:hypothetical protein